MVERTWSCVIEKCPKSRPHYLKLQSLLYWSALNTFAMETYLDIGLASSLNLHTMQWLDNNPDLYVTNIFAIICMIHIIIYPLWVFKFYHGNWTQWRHAGFQTKFGSVLEGTKYSTSEGKWLPLFSPMSFLLRRVSFFFIVIVMSKSLWLQLFV